MKNLKLDTVYLTTKNYQLKKEVAKILKKVTIKLSESFSSSNGAVRADVGNKIKVTLKIFNFNREKREGL